MRPSRRCSATFSLFWPSSDSLTDKSESWCFRRVVSTIDFVFTGLLITWLVLHHTAIRSRQSCSVFCLFFCCWVCTTLFPVVCSLVSSASIWHSAVLDGICRGRSLDAEEYWSQDWPLWHIIFNSSFRRVRAKDKDTLYPIFMVWTEKKATSSNYLNRQKVRFCHNAFLKSKKTSPDRSDLFIAESHESVNRPSAVLQMCLRMKRDWVGEKGLENPSFQKFRRNRQ